MFGARSTRAEATGRNSLCNGETSNLLGVRRQESCPWCPTIASWNVIDMLAPKQKRWPAILHELRGASTFQSRCLKPTSFHVFSSTSPGENQVLSTLRRRHRRGLTPLHWAAEKGHPATVDRLVAAGAAVDAKTSQGRGTTERRRHGSGSKDRFGSGKSPVSPPDLSF